jgi:hypothetical protein
LSTCEEQKRSKAEANPAEAGVEQAHGIILHETPFLNNIGLIDGMNLDLSK